MCEPTDDVNPLTVHSKLHLKYRLVVNVKPYVIIFNADGDEHAIFIGKQSQGILIEACSLLSVKCQMRHDTLINPAKEAVTIDGADEQISNKKGSERFQFTKMNLLKYIFLNIWILTSNIF